MPLIRHYKTISAVVIQRDHAALLKPGSRLLAVGLTIGMWSDGVTGSRAFYYQLFFLCGERITAKASIYWCSEDHGDPLQCF